MMHKQLLALFAAGAVLTACDKDRVDCEGGCSGPIVFEECVRNTVYFDFDKHNLKPEAQVIVAEQAKWMVENECSKATVTGFTDRRGTNAYNLALGARRAEAVKAGLGAGGVDGARVMTNSVGETQATGDHPRDRKAVTHIDEDGVPETPY
jgi:outer membrane protein OmpA-like peptidoglycan-associated protein